MSAKDDEGYRRALDRHVERLVKHGNPDTGKPMTADEAYRRTAEKLRTLEKKQQER